MTLSRLISAVAITSMLSFASISATQAEPLKVVSSFTIIGDMVKNVGGEHVVVDNLVGYDVDLHNFEPRARDIKKLTMDSGVKLLFINGMALEPWIERMQNSSGYKGQTIVVSEGVEAIKFADIHDNEHDHDDHDHDHDHDHHHHGEWDPHAWQNPLNAVVYVNHILQALKTTDPDNATAYEANAANYIAEIKKIDDEAKQAFAELPEEKRRFGTNHEAFAYLAEAYDLVQIPVFGVSGAEPSASQIADVLKELKAQQVSAVFLENTANNRLIEQVAHDSGVKVGGTLVADALQKEGEGATYLGMIKKNIRTLLEALK